MILNRRVLTLASMFMGLWVVCFNTASGQTSNGSPDLNSLSGDDLKTLTVKLERTGCRGTCPAYNLVIHGDGRLEYDGQNYVKEKGSRQGEVPIDRVKTLISDFAKADFFFSL